MAFPPLQQHSRSWHHTQPPMLRLPHHLSCPPTPHPLLQAQPKAWKISRHTQELFEQLHQRQAAAGGGSDDDDSEVLGNGSSVLVVLQVEAVLAAAEPTAGGGQVWRLRDVSALAALEEGQGTSRVVVAQVGGGGGRMDGWVDGWMGQL